MAKVTTKHSFYEPEVASPPDESRESTVSCGSSNNTETERVNQVEPPSETEVAAAADTAKMATCFDITTEDEEIEVRKEDGATELFNLIEGAKWGNVWARIQENPNEAKIWVISSGKDNALFSWDVWRRLPLHEACRRQPPPAVVYALLSAYPASAHVESNFGELPLHASVRCNACAEVVSCILAAYPAAVFARDKSGCTPMDILNGTGRITDHDAIIAALNRTAAFLMKEEAAFNWEVEQLNLKHKEEKEKQSVEYETKIDEKNKEIAELKRQLQQEKKATSTLAAKVIQTESVVQQKSMLEMRNMKIIEKLKEKIRFLTANNSSRNKKITDLEEIIESDRSTIIELTEVIENLKSQLMSICEEEQQYVADDLAKAEENLKAMFESQQVFLKETKKRKELLRVRLSRLGISMLSASMSEEEEDLGDADREQQDDDEEEEEKEEKEDYDDVEHDDDADDDSSEDEQSNISMPSSEEKSDDELAKIALVSARLAVESIMLQGEGRIMNNVQRTS